MRIQDLAVGVASSLRFPHIYALLRQKLTGSHVAVLVYHRVNEREDNWSLESLSPETFESHMKYLRQNYELLSLDRLAQYIRQGEPLPQKAAVVTFDDGYKDNYLYAYPILKKYGIPATIFLTSGHIDTGKLFWWDKLNYVLQHTTANHLELEEAGNCSLASDGDKLRASSVISDKLKALPEKHKVSLLEALVNSCGVNIPPDIGKRLILSWDEVIEMNRDGIEFGAHSVNHPILVNMPQDEAKWEIIQSKKDIEEKLQQPVTTFAYPNGSYFNSELVKFIEESGFTCAVSIRPGRLIKANNDLYDLNRVKLSGNLDKCQLLLCGFPGDFRITK